MAERHMPLDRPLRAAAIALLIACIGPPLAQAAAPGYEIAVGVIESDNIERLPTGGTDQTIGVVDLGFDWHDKRPWLDADIDAALSHLSYFQHAYNDEFIGNFLGLVRLNLAPDWLTWDIADNFGQAPLDPLAPITPANRENINYFNTGPTVSLPLGQTTQLALTGQYGRVTYQQSQLDSNRLTGAVGLLHELSPVSTISINVRDERIDFADDRLNPDYDRQEAFARLDTKGSRTQLTVDLGYSRLLLPGTRDSIPLVRLDLSHRLSAYSTIGGALGHDYSDGADSFRLVQTLAGTAPNTQPIAPAGPPFVSDYATLGWNFQYARTTLELAASYFRDRYQTDATLDNERTLLDALAARQITPMVRLALTEHVVRWHFDAADQTATETNTGLQLAWRLGEHLSIFAAYYLAKGSSSDIPAYNYTENRLLLSFGWGRAAELPPGPAPLRLPPQH